MFHWHVLDKGIRHVYIKPAPCRLNGKVCLNHTLLNEWAYTQLYLTEANRRAALPTWLHHYNHHRHHTSVGGPPANRVPNLTGQNT